MKKTILSSLFPVALLALSLGTAPVATGVDESFTFSLGGTPIPDGSPVGLSSDKLTGLDFSTSIVVITGLKVTLNIAGDPAGGWNGDLYAYLRHTTPAGTGFSVLLNRVGRTSQIAPGSFGYDDSGFNVTLDDLAVNGDIHQYQTVFTPAANTPLTGTWAPDARNIDPDTVVTGDARTALLSSFIGKTTQGTWSFFVADLSGGSQMTINSWGLELSGLPSANWYWKGATDNMWTSLGTGGAPNWTSDAAGTTLTLGIPNAISDVIFSASGAANQHTNLGADFTIHSLTIADPAAVTIDGITVGPTSTLTIAGDPGTGIDVQAGAGLATINANVTLGGTSDTISVANTAGLVINGVLGGGNGVTKAGPGTLTLSGANTYTGGTTLNNGILAISSDGNLGNNASGVAFNNNATLQTFAGVNFVATRAFTVNPTGGTIDTFGQASTLAGQISGTGLLSVIDSGAGGGKLTLTGDNSGLTGGLAVTGSARVVVSADNNLGNPVAYLSLSNGGTLETTATFSSDRPVHLSASLGTFLVDAGVTTTLNGLIDGTGAMRKSGPGTLVLTSDNTYGVTNLSGGSLFADVSPAGPTNQALGTGLLNIASAGVTVGTHVDGEVVPNALLVLTDFSVAPPAGGNLFLNGDAVLNGGGGGRIITSQNSGSGTHFGGAISGAATLTVASGVAAPSFNRVFFEGTTPNTYTGLTTVQANADLHLAKSDGVTAIAGNVQIDAGGVLVLDAHEQIADTSAVTVNSTGLAGAGNPSGFQLGGHSEVIGSLFGTGLVELDDKLGSAAGFLTVGAGNFSGVIADSNLGNGQLVKDTGGTLTLTGANTYKSSTTLRAGVLEAGNVKALGSGNFTMTGGTLRTTGGSLAVDIGAGNILFAGGTFAVKVGGLTPGVLHDQLKTTGIANTTGGTFALAQLNGFLLAPGEKVNILQAAGGVVGGNPTGRAVPASQVTGLSAFSSTPLLVPTLNLYPTTVTLEAMQGSFLAVSGLTPNQMAVARALDSVSAANGNKTGLFQEFNFLDTQSLTTLGSNLDKIAPEELTAIPTASISLANIQSANLERHLDDVRSQSSAPSASGMAAAGSGPSYSGGVNGPTGARSKEVAPPDKERWGMFLTGSGEFTRVGSTTNAAGFHLETGGVTAGVDYRVSDRLAIGMDFGYVNTTSSLVNGGKIETDGGRLGLYGTWFDRNFHVDAAVNGGLNSYKTRRTTPNNTAATGSPDGSEINILLATGYDWKIGGLTVGPTASYQYTNVRMDGFTENGAFAPLAVNSQNYESSRTALGIKATYDAHVGRVLVRPEVKLAWQHEFGDSTYSITSRFASLGGNAFTVTGAPIGRDSLLVGAGFSVLWNPRFATYVYYDGELGRTNYSSHSVSAGFRLQF
jgi:outer membrane autotransporter protein